MRKENSGEKKWMKKSVEERKYIWRKYVMVMKSEKLKGRKRKWQWHEEDRLMKAGRNLSKEWISLVWRINNVENHSISRKAWRNGDNVEKAYVIYISLNMCSINIEDKAVARRISNVWKLKESLSERKEGICISRRENIYKRKKVREGEKQRRKKACSAAALMLLCSSVSYLCDMWYRKEKPLSSSVRKIYIISKYILICL